MEAPYKTQLKEVFSNLSEQQIDATINIVLEQSLGLSSDELLEEMINLLVESGDSTLTPNASNSELSVDGEVAAAAGVSLPTQDQIQRNLDRFVTLFPEISVEYLVNFCQQYSVFDFDQIVEDLTGTDYVKADKDPLDVWEHLKQMLPNADPIYLRNQARVLVTRPDEELQEFIENAIEKNDYPTMQQYLVNKELEEEFVFYVTKFSANAYLNKIPNPVETFFDQDRKPVLSGEANEHDLEFALTFFYNQFLLLRQNEIAKVFKYYDRHLIKTYDKLKSLPKAFRKPRALIPPKECKNVELLQEIAFLKNEKVIRQLLKQKDAKYREALEDARANGFLHSCACCFDDELIPEECYFCVQGCIFCKQCVKRGAENVIGKEETKFPCLADCNSEFDYSTLQMVLDTKTLQGVWHRKQIEEIRNANIDGLETCLFCDFSMIPDEGDKIFKCANPSCMAEICRLCRHRAHVPLRCNEIEYDEDVKIRTFIENKMTEALLRKCWKCGKFFYKGSGCNKMTCFCGAKMCYVCKQAVTDYSHFSESGCPLFTDNIQQFHLGLIQQAALAAKTELGVTVDPTKLKFDPIRGIERDVA